ncbi:MAG: VOC family protein [Alphaproteobacteria bacterium]
MSLLKTSQPARDPNPVARAQRLNHLVLARPDLAKAEKFFGDFGLVTTDKTDSAIYMRAAAAAPYCLEIRKGPKAELEGIGLQVSSAADLDALAALPGAQHGASSAPGAGDVVVLHDPSGRRIEALYDQSPYDALPVRAPLAANTPDKIVRVNAGQRAAIEPPQITKLGHVVLEASRYQEMAGWYTKTFGLIPSDIEVLPDGSPAVAFFRFDCGETPSDHHSIAMAQSFTDKCAHAAFEVVDQDAVGIGQKVLRDRGYKHAWGIGRHILGSQIFDYWRDPYGEIFEHYCDGDVFTADVPTGIHAAGGDTLYQWGQKLPGDFTRPKMSLETIVTLVRNVRASPDLSFGKLIAMLKAVS